jgi:hypothetical protein
MAEVPFLVRLGHAGDHPFVLSSWLGSDRFSRTGQACPRVYNVEHERVVRAILARSTVVLRVACATDDEDALLGWAAMVPTGELPCVHYVYVKRGVRRSGIASALVAPLQSQRCEYSHQLVVRARDLRPPNLWTYNPYRSYR